MRINPIGINRPLSRAQTVERVRPVEKGLKSIINIDGAEMVPLSEAEQEALQQSFERRRRRAVRLDGLGNEVDVWI
jgi:hypothetical protein